MRLLILTRISIITTLFLLPECDGIECYVCNRMMGTNQVSDKRVRNGG